MEGIIKEHDRDRFEIYAFYFGPNIRDKLREKFEESGAALCFYDVPLLFEYFATSAAAMHKREIKPVTSAVLNTLMSYHWPGNVRELQNVIASLTVCAPRTGTVDVAALPVRLQASPAVTLARARQTAEASALRLAKRKRLVKRSRYRSRNRLGSRQPRRRERRRSLRSTPSKASRTKLSFRV